MGLNQGLKGYIAFINKIPAKVPDKDVWNNFMGIIETPKMDDKQLKDIMFLMINSYLSRSKLPQKINVNFDSGLIDDTKLTPKEVRGLLNNFLNEKLNNITQ